MATIAEVRAGAKAWGEAVGLITHAYFPAAVNAPCLVVDVTQRRPNVRSGNGSGYTVRLTLFYESAQVVSEAVQAGRDEYLDSAGERSIQAKVQANSTMGGIVRASTVRTVEPSILEWPADSGQFYWGGTVEVDVLD
jgi:hypothetical protein